jgi:hypothetical protein
MQWLRPAAATGPRAGSSIETRSVARSRFDREPIYGTIRAEAHDGIHFE